MFVLSKTRFFKPASLFLLALLALPLLAGAASEAKQESSAQNKTAYFKIRVVDEETGRGIPMVELKTTNAIRYYTDSQGIAAFFEPGLMNKTVFFSVKSHGYSYPEDGFGNRGVRLQVKPGGSAEIQMQRENLAERLYRITGQGIYRDSVLTGAPTPTENPVLNGQVMGQDSTLSVVYKNKIFWFWGDTARPQYPLGNFKTSGATSNLPNNGGLDPAKGINLHYFVDEDGFSKPMAPFVDRGLIWADGFMALKDESGSERLVAHYNHMESLGKKLGHGLMIYNDAKEAFEKWIEFDMAKQWQAPGRHPVRISRDGEAYFYFARPFFTVRVKADWQAIQDPSHYEAFTCLKQGSQFKGQDSHVELKAGRPVYAWKTNTDPIGPEEEMKLIESGIINEEHRRYLLKAPNNGRWVRIHSNTVRWNEYREKWIMIGVEAGGLSSYLGEVWYAEANSPTGPWENAVKIATHDQYSFYHPAHHPFFDQQGGRIIYFDGTYTNMFSGTEQATPGYDYNLIMYRLDLANLPFARN